MRISQKVKIQNFGVKMGGDIVNKVKESKEQKENLYDFRERMCNSFSDVEIKIENKNKSIFNFGDSVRYSPIDSEVIETALLDLNNFFRKININFIKDDKTCDLLIKIDENIFGAETGNGFILNVQKNKITITGNNERGVCQGIYYIEKLIVNDSCLSIGTYTRRARFSPRMIHSGYELDVFPNEYLSVIAHHGFDAIVVFAKSTDRTAIAELDFNETVKKAKKYGIDFYVYSYVNIYVSPFDKNAKEIYDEKFGSIFKDCPDIKGIILIGESNQFPSIDENTEQYSLFDELPHGKLPPKKPSSGWWPCSDYPQWVSLVRDSVRKYNKDADIVLWTYNWGFAPSKYRKELLENLPTDISVCVTWDMNQREKIGEIYEIIPDYGIQSIGPSPSFIDEAEIAKRRGIKLYAMTNTCGRTWDFGGMPYMPMMYQWADRCEKLVEAQEKYGLSGLLESHHYGFFPSFISELNNSFFMDGENNSKAIDVVSKRIAKESSLEFKKAMRKWSNAMKNYVTTDEDQYGPCRVGTAYPLCLRTALYPPQDGGVLFGCAIYRAVYDNMDVGKSSPFGMRIRPEIKRFTRMAELMKEGIDILSKISTRTKELDRIQNLGEYLYHCVITVINVKKFWIQKMALLTATTKKQIETAIMKIEKIASEEIENAKDSIKNLEFDSSLGYEASMGYQADASRVLWKIEQVRYMLEVEIGKYKEAISITLETDGNNYYRF